MRIDCGVQSAYQRPLRKLDEISQFCNGIEVDDGGPAIRQGGAEAFEHAVCARALGHIVNRVSHVEDPGPAITQLFLGVAFADHRLNHFQIDITPLGEGIAIGEPAAPLSITAFVVGIQSPERPAPQQAPVMVHSFVDIVNHDADLTKVPLQALHRTLQPPSTCADTYRGGLLSCFSERTYS